MQATSFPETATHDAAAIGSSIPWYLWCAALAVTSAYIGGYWDISWHRSIGRDTFWTPAHIAIYLCGVLAGISCAFLILSTTFQDHAPLQDASLLSFNQATAERASLPDVIEACARHGVPGISIWRHKLAETGVDRAARHFPLRPNRHKGARQVRNQ